MLGRYFRWIHGGIPDRTSVRILGGISENKYARFSTRRRIWRNLDIQKNPEKCLGDLKKNLALISQRIPASASSSQQIFGEKFSNQSHKDFYQESSENF